MRYLVTLNVPVEAGVRIEQQSGGPGEVFSKIVETFKPESFYCGLDRRSIYLVLNADNPTRLAEFMITASTMTGVYPEFIPVAPANEMQPIVNQAMNTLNKFVPKR
ncbi:MAG: hypothetical protein C4523_09430 [Myxococcales bacterium]|nr:MAG: hypothetical protein C4523_09430 [Myxococcales bacterium]